MHSLIQRLLRIRPWQLFATALGVRLLLLVLHHPTPALTENVRAGLTLATQGDLANPFVAPTGPTAHVSPAYPGIVAVIALLSGGATSLTSLLLQLTSATVASLNIALLPSLAATTGLPAAAGVVASLLWIPPWFRWVEMSGEHETVYTALAAILLLRLIASTFRKPNVTSGRAALLGFVTGVASHTSPLLLPATVVAAFVHGRALPVKDWIRFGAVALLAFSLAVTPYTVRNYVALDGLIFIRDNLGLELAVSNNARARAEAIRNIESGGMRAHPFSSKAEAEKVRSLGEVAYNRTRLAEARAWIRDNPAQFVTLTAQRAGRMLYPYSPRLYHSLLGVFITLLFLLGMGVLPRRDRLAARSIAAFVVGFSFIYLFVQHDIRYWYPMLQLQSVVAGAVMLRVLDRSREAS